MLTRTIVVAIVVLVGILAISLTIRASAADLTEADIEPRFEDTVRPFVTSYCVSCHSGENAMAQFDLSKYTSVTMVVEDHSHWSLLKGKLTAKEMPPAGTPQPAAEVRQKVIDWVGALLKSEAQKRAGDPGLVLARRLSNAEYNYTIRDLTGVDIRPTREFPLDPSNQAGFDNSGESLAMSPALLDKYLQAAREVASHMTLGPAGFHFAPYPILADSDRDKYGVSRIIEFYDAQNTDYSDYFQTAWRFKYRAALGKPEATLASLAAEYKVSPKYLGTIWTTLEMVKEEVGPAAKLQSMWRSLPVPESNQPHLAKAGADQMRDFVIQIRKKTVPKVSVIAAPGGGRRGARGSQQPFLMDRNWRYAENRLRFDPTALQVEGEPRPVEDAAPPPPPPPRRAAAADDDDDAPPPRQEPPRPTGSEPDPNLFVPAGQRPSYEAAFTRFSAVFPDTFYIRERGPNFPNDITEGHRATPGRLLGAGIGNEYGFFRDDSPLYELLLNEKEQKELDALWRQLDFFGAAHRMFLQAHRRAAQQLAIGGAAQGARGQPEAGNGNQEITSEESISRLAEDSLSRMRAASATPAAIKAVEDYYAWSNANIRRVEKERLEAETIHLAEMQKFAARAYRRPLSQEERDELLAFYRSVRETDGLNHEEAMRDVLVSVLMSPDFSYRIDLSEAGGSAPAPRGSPAHAARPSPEKPSAAGAVPLSGYTLASRLSYYLWSSMPDEELLARAAAGDLGKAEVIAAQARRMLKDDRARALATEFAGNWLEFRRFEEHNSVDRERFPSFTNALREAMFAEPVHFVTDLIRNNRPVLDLLYAKHTFVNPVLAKHYGMTDIDFKAGEWLRVEDADRHGRGGLLPMAVFLTKNAPGLRTSPVKRGYWVVRQVLGEVIPPPPAMVPELPRDEAKLELTLRETLARHRQDPSCASCHARFDSFGLTMESYGPVGEARTKDLAGRPVDARAEFPDGSEGTGLEGLRSYIHERRQNDFVDNLCRKMMVYALGRGLLLSDEPAIEAMRTMLAANQYRFHTLIESIVSSPQFLTKRDQGVDEQKGE